MSHLKRTLLLIPVLFTAALLLLTVACGSSDDEDGVTPASQASSPAPESIGRLLVADTTAESVYVYSVPGFEQLARFDGMKLSAHMGAIALPDGRAIFVDDANSQIVVLSALGEVPEVVARVDAASPAIWGAVDPDLEYLVYASEPDESAEKLATATLLSLEDYETHELQVPMGGDGELHVALGGDPLTLFAATAAQLHGYLVSDVIAGAAQPVVSVPVNPSLHGAVITHDSPPRILLSSSASFDVFDYDGATLSESRPLAWEVNGLEGGRNGRPRLSSDGKYVYGTLAATVEAEAWQTRQNDIHIVDLTNETVNRLSVAPGIVGRFQISARYALIANIQEDADFAILFDVDPMSATFQQIVARIPLEQLENGPVAGETATGKEARGAAITPDGRWAFLSNGGAGTISVIDTDAQAIVTSIALPTSIQGGGYLLALQEGASLADTQVR